MWLHFWKRRARNTPYALDIQCTAIYVLFGLSVLVVACGGPTTNTDLGQPQVTVTINLDQANGPPTPPLPQYSCSAWVTNTTPNINGTTTVDVYAKFEHNLNGNPVGVFPAQGTASVLWPEGLVNISANTTSDGLAVFPVSIANRKGDLNKIVLVTVTFSGPQGIPPCVVTAERAAFFSLVIASATPSSHAGTPPTATVSPSPSPSPCPTPRRKKSHVECS
jgi:hypothetical protein